MEDRLAALLKVAQQQTEVDAEPARVTNDYPAAGNAYRRYIDSAKALLSAEVEFNETFPGSPLSIAETARPIVNALLVSADIEYALGRLEAAGALRDEAVKVSFQYLGHDVEIDAKRTSAGAAAPAAAIHVACPRSTPTAQ